MDDEGMNRKWINAKESAKYLGITVSALYHRIYNKELVPYYLGKSISFTKEYLDSCLKNVKETKNDEERNPNALPMDGRSTP